MQTRYSFMMICLLFTASAIAGTANSLFMVENARLVPQAGTWLVFGGEHSILLRNEGTAALNFQNLRIAGAPVHIHSHTAITIHGHMQSLPDADALVLLSTEGSTASLIHHSDGVQATVQRYIPAVNDWLAQPATDWHMISAPVIGQEISGFIPGDGEGGYDFYGWSETDDMWINFKQTSSFIAFNGGLLFNEGQGYLVAYEMSQLFSFRGELRAGDISCNSLTHTPPNEYAGWHLLGNPYAAALDWNSSYWYRPEVNDEVHVWDRHRGNYISNNNGIGDFDGVICPHRAMFVKTANPTKAASLDIPAAARKHGGMQANKDPAVPVQPPRNTLRLQVRAAGSHRLDATWVLLREDASVEFDRRYDAHKLHGSANAPALYSRKMGRELSIQSIDAGKDNIMVPLLFKPGSYEQFSLTAEGVDGIDANYDVLLLDLLDGKRINLRLQQEYAFASGSNGTEERFLLIFIDLHAHSGQSPGSNHQQVHIYSYERNIYVNLPASLAPATMTVTTPDGRQCLVKQLYDDGLHVVEHGCQPGVLLVRIATGEGCVAAKVISQ